MSTWTIKENSTGELVTTVEGETWEKAKAKAFDKLAKNVEIEGFRKGKAPKKLIEKQIAPQQIWMEAAESGAQAALEEGIKEHDLWVIARPELAIDEINEEKVAYRFTVTVKPEVKLGEYKGLTYQVNEEAVSEEELNAELTKIQENFAELVVKEEGTVENGDTAVIDFEGFKNEVAFEGGKGENYPLEIGSGSFIPGFEEQLIGMSKEEAKEINVTFPENYQSEELAGQPVVFKVTVHEIKHRTLPELNDELAKDVNIDNVDTLEQLKDYIKEQLSTQKKNQAENAANEAMLNELSEGAEVVIPQIMIEQETNEMINDYGRRLQQQGLNLNQFMQITGQTMETMKEQMAPDAEKRVKLRLVLEEVAYVEQLAPTEEEIEKEYNEIATAYKMEVEKVKELIPSDNIHYDLQLRKAVDFVKDAAK